MKIKEIGPAPLDPLMLATAEFRPAKRSKLVCETLTTKCRFHCVKGHVVGKKACSHCAICDCDLFVLAMDCIGAGDVTVA